MTVQIEAVATKTLSEEESPNLIAIGQEFTHEGEVKIAKVFKKVIFAAGTIHSTLLLKLSRIGSPKILEVHGIDSRL